MAGLECDDPRWRWVFVILATLLVICAALFLYLLGWFSGAGLLYSLSVIVLFGFALAGAIGLALLAYGLFRRWCKLRNAPPKGQGTRESSGPGAVHLPSTIYKRPDPLIYSQYFLMAQNLAVTWDNPDIWLTELPAPDGTMTPVASNDLVANHVYRVHARVYNGSLEAPAVGLPIVFSFLTFGIGITSTPFGLTVIDLPVKGASGHPVETFHDWLTPPTLGHYCLQVALFWLDDAEPGNNVGQENVDVKKLASPATFTFPVRNAAPIRRLFRLDVDSYPPPTPPDCPEPPPTDPHGRPGARVFEPVGRVARLAEHRRDAHPLAPGWSVNFSTGPEFVLAAGQEVNVTAVVTAPGAVPTPTPVNVNAFADGVLAGGVTLYVHS